MGKEVEQLFHNYYECPDCGYRWDDYWESIVEDDCPNCGFHHIMPYDTQDV